MQCHYAQAILHMMKLQRTNEEKKSKFDLKIKWDTSGERKAKDHILVNWIEHNTFVCILHYTVHRAAVHFYVWINILLGKLK